MSIFLGPINELPYVSVDNFELPTNEESTCFFLTHCHTDHMKGLHSDSFLSHMIANPLYTLYCSTISKLILDTYVNLKPIENQIKDLNITGINTIHVPARNALGVPYYVDVSLIPAGHCPGSVMYLFESIQKAVLYTGDFRLAVGDVMKFQQLHDKNDVKTIDKLYLDATFFHESYWEFPKRDDSVAEIIKIIKPWLEANPQNLVLLKMTASYGGEHIIKKIAEKFKCQVHVQPYLHRMYAKFPEISGVFTEQCLSTRIHAINSHMKDTCLVNARNQNVLLILPKAAPFQCRENQKITMSREGQCQRHYTVNYSSHSSYKEIVDFLTYLKPKEVHICTKPFERYYACDERDSSLEMLLRALNKPCKSTWSPKISHEHFNRTSNSISRPCNLAVPTSITVCDLDDPPFIRKNESMTNETNNGENQGKKARENNVKNNIWNKGEKSKKKAKPR